MEYTKLTRKELLEKIEELESQIEGLNDYIDELEMTDSDEVLELRDCVEELEDKLENNFNNFIYSLKVGRHDGININKLEEYYKNYIKFN